MKTIRKKRVNETARARYKKNPKRQRAASLKWYKKNKKRINANRSAWRKRHPTQAKAFDIKRRHGITLKDFSSFRKTQGNSCAICFKRFRKSPHIDHDHQTGKVRGLLCLTCNAGIGMFKDTIAIVESAAKYLRRSVKCV